MPNAKIKLLCAPLKQNFNLAIALCLYFDKQVHKVSLHTIVILETTWQTVRIEDYSINTLDLIKLKLELFLFRITQKNSFYGTKIMRKL